MRRSAEVLDKLRSHYQGLFTTFALPFIRWVRFHPSFEVFPWKITDFDGYSHRHRSRIRSMMVQPSCCGEVSTRRRVSSEETTRAIDD